MYCLAHGEAITNRENGRFTCDDLVWALQTVRKKAEGSGGAMCGGWKRPQSETRFQQLAGWFDHPATTEPKRQDLLSTNLVTLERLWPALTGA